MMDKKECTELFSMIDRKIDTLDLLQAEYLRGYKRGKVVHFLGVSDDRTDEHSLLIDHSGGGSGDPYIDSYARGYRDGFEGMTPESPPLTSIFSGPPLIAV